MGKIHKTMQPKHRETLSPWLKDFVQSTCDVPLPALPQHLDSFPITKWPLPRGDLYHWIPLLNRFDTILEDFNKIYQLSDGAQTRDFGCDLLLGGGTAAEYHSEEKWDSEKLRALGYSDDGDAQLIRAILQFTRRLLSHCGNRSIYASSPQLNDLLNSTNLSVVHATLEVGLELAQRYQASVKRMSHPNRQFSNALLANHYNIELDRVQQIAQPFVKTPIISLADITVQTTPVSASKSKEKEKAQSPSSGNSASMLANDLTTVISRDSASDSRWKSWGDLKVIYYPKNEGAAPIAQTTTERPNSSAPNTPTPLRRSSTMGNPPQTTPRNARTTQSTDETPSPAYRSPAANADVSSSSSQRSLEIPQAVVASTPIHDLLKRTPEDMPKNSQYEVLNRSRICKALLGGPEARQQALAVRLLAVANLSYIHPESVFLEQVVKQDNDEPRRYHLVYQLVELLHPSTPGQPAAPRWLQTIVMSLLEGMAQYNAKYQDVLSALNATVNHGVLLYVIRKAVVEMKEGGERSDQESVELDDWRESLFSLASYLALNGRIGTELMSAGLMDVLVDIINMRTPVADRWHNVAVTYVDNLILNYGPTAFQAFNSARGLENAAQLMIHTTSSAKSLAESGQGTRPDYYSSVVDYEIPFYQQQTLKWLLKLIHHIMSPNSFPHGGNTERLLRNLVDNSELLGSLRTIMENTKAFGSVVWTNSISLLTDFVNNDPTSFAAISETGMFKSLLESLTGRPIPPDSAADRKADEPPSNENGGSPVDESVSLEPDERPHPPDEETLRAPRSSLASGVLPSSEAIGVIIPVINAICLNNTGMRLVSSSRALESILEIFESPEHVRLMHADQDIPYNIGLQIDELGRHHPAMRPTIANAVLDMIARVLYLGKSKAETAGWGIKLQGDNTAAPASSAVAASRKGKEVADSSDDVEMTDVTQLAEQPAVQHPDLSEGPANKPESITPYISTVALFLQSYVTNASLRGLLTRNGGINYLLDLLELPSLPHEFASPAATPASRTLQQVVATVIDSAPVIGMPALLNRLQDAIAVLEPVVSASTSASTQFFRPFVEARESGGLSQQLTQGTEVAKALLNVQSLLRTLQNCIPSSRGTPTLPPVNVYDQFLNVVKSLGPLFRAVLLEEIYLARLVPPHWTSRSASVRAGVSPDVLVDDQEAFLSQILGHTNVDTTAADTDRQDFPVSQEQLTAQYHNYQVLRILLHYFKPSVYSFLQTLGKALMSRRERDNYVRAKHMQIADALAETVLGQLEPSIDEPATLVNLNYWTVWLHVVYQMLIDSSRRDDRAGPHIILPVLDAFKQHHGLDTLNKMVVVFASEVNKDRNEAEDVSAVKVAAVGLQKTLDLYSLILNGKNISESVHQVNVTSRATSSRQPDFYHQTSQFIVETRMAVLPVVTELWRSPLIERASSDVVSRVVEILKAICQGEQENSASRRNDSTKVPPLFKRESVKFSWASHAASATRLAEEYPEDLAREAVYRASGLPENAREYCRLHQRDLAGRRNPIPAEDAYEVPSPAENGSAPRTAAGSSAEDRLRLDLSRDPMVVDSVPELAQVIADELAGEGRASQDSMDEESPVDHAESASTPAAATPPVAPSTAQDHDDDEIPPVSKEDLDAERETLRKDLIDRCLDVIRAHPDSVFEVSELINVAMGIDRQESQEARQEVGDTLANALMSFALDDEEKKSNGRSIAAYAHLLSLMLHGSVWFFTTTVKTLRDNISDYLSFLKVPPGNSTDELPPWIPHILLIFEMLLAEDAQPVEAKWTPPRNESDEIQAPVLQTRAPIIQEEQRKAVLESVLDILPRIGKNENLAVAVLRILVILTRNRSVAKLVGDKRNLQRLFVMAKQLSGLGSARLKEATISGNLMTILRHIIEDDETVRQIMRSEIRKYFEQGPHRSSRGVDIPTYTRHLSHVALRSPEVFIEVTNDTVKLVRFVPGGESQANGRGVALMLKEKPAEKPAETQAASLGNAGSESVEPAVQTLTEELTISDVKPTTEPIDKAMVDATKSSPAETKRPVVENPDGVVHFLLCELLNYREVADKEPSDTAKESITPVGDATPGTPNGGDSTPSAEDQPVDSKDKKVAKSTFKADEHPIFVYRCFLLNCLSELLQSYTRTKMEFINFKRSAPLFANTPIKPRTGVLNYLLQDLLCMSSLTNPLDSVAAKKKAATSEQARQVLVALVAKTPEKPIDRTRDRFDYEDDSDLLFVRKWVLDMILRSYKDAATPHEPFDVRYAKLLSLAELMLSMIGEKDRDSSTSRVSDPSASRSHLQLKRLMYEKGFLPALTASVADIDLTFPGVKRTIKYILRVLQVMTGTAIALSQANLLPSGPLDSLEDEIASASSLSDLEDDREETPDLYRNSALGMLEAGREDDFEDDSDDDEDEEMDYEDEYPEELDYGDEMSQDGEEDVSDEDEELGEMGEIEGLPGHPVGVEVIMEDDDEEDDDDEDDDMDDDEELSEDDDEDEDDEDALEQLEAELEDRIEIVDDEGNPLGDDGAPGWEDETDDDDDGDEDEDGQDYDDGVQDLDELADMDNPLHLLEGQDLDGHHHHHHILAEEGFNFGGADRFDDEGEEDDDDEEDDQVDMDDDYIYDYPRPGDDIAPPAMPSGLGWDALVVERGPPRRHRPFPVGPFVMGPRGGTADPLSGMSIHELEAHSQELSRRMQAREREIGSLLSQLIRNRRTDPETDFRSYFRTGRSSGPPTNADDGLNPLLRRDHNAGRDFPPRPAGHFLSRGGLPGIFENPMHILSDLMASLPPGITPPRGFSLHITQGPGDRGVAQDFNGNVRPGQHSHTRGVESRRDVFQEPQQAVAFAPVATNERWSEEARVIFGHTHVEKAARLNVCIWARLVPEAAEQEKKAKADEAERRRKDEEERQKRLEEERLAREAKEAEEKAAREKAEAEERERERERLERLAAEAEAEAQATAEHEGDGAAGSEDTEPQPMEGVETSEAARHAEAEPAAAPRPRVLTTIRGEEVDITDLGIDLDYFEALPDEFREEVIAQTITSRRTEAREAAAAASASAAAADNPPAGAGEQQGEVYQEFLDALPEELRMEIQQQERQERRRIERENARRQAAASGQAQDMDTASILASFPADLRDTVLLEQGDQLMDQLPPEMAAQARALAERVRGSFIPRARDAARNVAEPTAGNENKVQRRTVVQMLDKAGVATLLRLMFVSQQGSIRGHLFRVLGDICENRQNRFEVIGSLLSILQFGSTDMEAVERSFSALSLKAKQPKDKEKEKDKDKDMKTPQSLKRTFTSISVGNNIQQSSEISPLLVVQQCLDLLVELSARNPHVPSYFLTEHDPIANSLKQNHNRKGKSKDLKVQKYAINSLLHLLDRDLVMESSTVMQLLVDLLNKLTLPLHALERRRKEAEEEAKKAAEKAKEEAEKAKDDAETTTDAATTGAVGTTNAPAEASQESSKAMDSKTVETAEQKRIRQIQPPIIPADNLKLVVKIFVARECSSKTFKDTISTIKNLSNIPEAKQVFGRELVQQAQILSKNIVSDLDELLPHIEKAESGTEIQGLALAKFSPGASEQNKLLRVLTALDHLFETKKDGTRDAGDVAAADEKSSLLMTLYHNETFNKMWEKLGACLSAIHKRDNMINVATILLPLIESLMVVCKNTTIDNAPSATQAGKDIVLSSPPPDDTMAGLFFSFTDAHRRILNELVRQNNKLMSGTFSLLVKNPKVLEFDNKRSYFNRTVHAKNSGHSRPSASPLSVGVRRDNVFHDSYRNLAFKRDEEVKYGKLNVRFHGEEGVDAGGVTREWFQVLTRAMFDPNYALFTPVSSDRTTFHPNKASHVNEEHLNFFKFIGRIIGKAVYEGRLLECYFSRAMYKRILGKPVSVKDMESFDPEFYKSLTWILENDITNVIVETFSVEEDEFGMKTTVDLIEDGRNIEVTNENKHEYVRLIVEHRLLSSVKEQMDHFLTGFHGIIPADLISIFNEQELELLISGLPDIDVDDWKSNTEYHNYSAASQQIQWFWRAVRSFDKEEQAKLLQFVTGTSKVPLNGFKELEGMNGINRFNIHRDYGNKERLPSSHTCFNQLDLPEYETYDNLRSQVLKAITTGSDYFGFA